MRFSPRHFFSLANIQMYWLFVIITALYLAFGQINTSKYAVPVMASLIAAGLVLHSVHYQWTSFVTIFTLCHVIAYPIGTLLVLSLSSPSLAIEPAIWDTTPLGLWGMVVGMVGLMFGVLIVRLRIVHSRKKMHKTKHPIRLTPVWFNVSLMLVVVPLVVFYIQAGTYYHKDVTGIDEYNFSNAATFGFIGYLSYISYIGTILQVRRYLYLKTKRDLIYTTVCIVIPFVVMLPSGSRVNTLLVLVIALLYFLEHERLAKIKYSVLFSSILLLAVLTMSIEAYRIAASLNLDSTFISRIASSAQFLLSPENDRIEYEKTSEISRAIIGRRLSDHHSVGYLMSVIPENFPHRGFTDMEQFAFYLLPTMVRPQISLDYNYDAALLMDTYSFRPNIGGSSPMLVVGELYERVTIQHSVLSHS
ncbi:MAG: hypothetical protein PHF56_04990 [Desulfuromonadaceae bacterium]|nr:hypothetical protein [Desulfuromonadaceae bacterium]